MNHLIKPKIHIFLATYNRPQMVCFAIDSILSQSFKDFVLIVSDNSTDDQTQKVIKEKYLDALIYRRRLPSLTSFNHFDKMLSEVDSDYFMIFHDDDIMLPNMIGSLIKHFDYSYDKNVLAVGANALTMKNNINTNQRFRKKNNHDLMISTPSQLAKLYSVKNSIVPFASYLYKKEIAKSISLDINKGGKYCDVAYLLDICCVGSILNLDEPLMILNQHDNQDSNNHVFQEKSKLINYITKITNLSRRDKLILSLRLNNLYGEIHNLYKANHLKFWSYKNLKFMLIFIKYRNSEYFLKTIIRSIQLHILQILKR
jgi:glycosyltransferase involved in cell wall biosynthesis